MKILVCLANGSEELEYMSIYNTLKRADYDVISVKVPENDKDSDSLQCKCKLTNF